MNIRQEKKLIHTEASFYLMFVLLEK